MVAIIIMVAMVIMVSMITKQLHLTSWLTLFKSFIQPVVFECLDTKPRKANVLKYKYANITIPLLETFMQNGNTFQIRLCDGSSNMINVNKMAVYVKKFKVEQTKRLLIEHLLGIRLIRDSGYWDIQKLLDFILPGADNSEGSQNKMTQTVGKGLFLSSSIELKGLILRGLLL